MANDTEFVLQRAEYPTSNIMIEIISVWWKISYRPFSWRIAIKKKSITPYRQQITSSGKLGSIWERCEREDESGKGAKEEFLKVRKKRTNEQCYESREKSAENIQNEDDGIASFVKWSVCEYLSLRITQNDTENDFKVLFNGCKWERYYGFFLLLLVGMTVSLWFPILQMYNIARCVCCWVTFQYNQN